MKAVLDKTLPINTVSPAFQWAQSPEELFISVKFAHKLDAPATLNVEAENVTVNSRTVILHASDGRKRFYLEIPLLKEIVPENSTWAMASVGRMTFTLSKKMAPAKWARLLVHKNKLPNMHFWWELHEQHAESLEKLKIEEEAKENEDKNNSTASVNNATAADPEGVQKTKPDAVLAESSKGDASNSVDPELAALIAERDAINKDLKVRLAAIDEETRKRKKEQDLMLKDAKATIDKETDSMRQDAQKNATDLKTAIEAKISALEQHAAQGRGIEL